MKDIEELCNRIIIIDKGTILYDDSLKDIKYQFGNTKTIIIPSNIDISALLEKYSSIQTEDMDD